MNGALLARAAVDSHPGHPEFIDLVPRALRQQWREQGLYQGLDLFSSFYRLAMQQPQALAVADAHYCLNYQQLLARALSLAKVLQQQGVVAGDVVAVNLANGWQACALDLAVAALGAVVLPFPIGRKKHESRSLLQRSGAKALVCARWVGESDYGAMIDELGAQLPALRIRILQGPCLEGWLDLEQLWDGPQLAYEAGWIDADGPARLIASSGSESEPKLVAYSHNGLLGGQAAYLDSLSQSGAPVRALFCVPLASPFGSLATSCVMAAQGGALVTLPRFDPDEVLRAVVRYQVTHLYAGPNMVDLLLASPLLQQKPWSKGALALEAIISGGSALSAETARGVKRLLGCSLIQSYGSADGVACHTALDDPASVLVSSVGKPDPRVVSVRIMDEQQQALALGEVGEIWALGPMTPLCYYGAPELNQSARAAGGWVKTGDKGRLDAEGRLQVVGRKSDVILRKGVKVNAGELEMLLHEHPQVLDVAVVAVPQASGEGWVQACVVLRDPREGLSLEAVNHFLQHQIGLERFKWPDAISVHRAFPLAPSGKVDKATLRDELSSTNMNVSASCVTLSAAPILDLLTGVERAGVLRAAIELKVFDGLAEHPASAATLARQLGTSERGMRILLSALAGLGLLHIGDNGCYGLNDLSRRYLLSQSQQYVGGLAHVYSADLMWETFRDFKSAVIAGKSTLAQNIEADDHPYWQEFAAGIESTSRTTARRLVKLLDDWTARQTPLRILDVACGNGIYGFTFAQQYPQAQVTGLDWPSVASVTEGFARQFGVAERARVIGGDIFSVQIPGQYELVIMSQILHHFDPERCRQLIARARGVLAPGGKLLISDFMTTGLDPALDPLPRLFAAQMLGLTDCGDTYAVSFIQSLLLEQGFTEVTAQPLKGLPIHCLLASSPT
ncbi:AMP-binding protein [Pseudomonas proteolytica]|uniref:AMP-binding protein n=1 Tax=Pseudomonas proteolytica TaxID=219574 RepID=UPI001251B6B4|nr:AMP-binding protein [Pseudomonas proteolytica]NMZ01424.1 AMP-binding protein [Pseudomonas proteolytica]NMZ10080.1 AMP-binding protein [Pseudomonas proteolytica]VVN74718.1 2-succinylbenzoate--CoA ligase [Pseudomonas fluorescens]